MLGKNGQKIEKIEKMLTLTPKNFYSLINFVKKNLLHKILRSTTLIRHHFKIGPGADLTPFSTHYMATEGICFHKGCDE